MLARLKRLHDSVFPPTLEGAIIEITLLGALGWALALSAGIL